jgi:alpha-D-ribose 1-methylphosphonate 5-triphosphate synthase subunit PhnH
MTQSLAIEGGFADPVLGAQGVFRSLMDSFARPGTIQSLGNDVAPPEPLTAGLALVALTLCDHDTSLWLDADLAESAAVTAWLRFHTGTVLVSDPADAEFALVSRAELLPALADFPLGSDEYPDRSTTIVLAVESLSEGVPLTLRGPGIKDTATLSATGLPDDFIAQWSANREEFPRGVDLLLVCGDAVVGLPRTTRISEGSA